MAGARRLRGAGGLVLYATSGIAMAAWCGLTALGFLVWYTVESWFRRRGAPPRWLFIGTVLVESSAPWLFLVVITFTEGPAYALGSWVPPMAWAALIVDSTARLRPWWPIMIGATGALTFPNIYFALIRPLLMPAELAFPLYQPVMQISRSFALGAGGLLVMMVSNGLRGAIVKADTAARERDLFGKNRLERRIASGGMGTVYEATYCPEGGFERRVAVKQIHPHPPPALDSTAISVAPHTCVPNDEHLACPARLAPTSSPPTLHRALQHG